MMTVAGGAFDQYFNTLAVVATASMLIVVAEFNQARTIKNNSCR